MSLVLVVDDEPDVRLVARVVLGSAGHEVHDADSGEAALALLERGPVPDVILLDVRMPGIDGWEVLRRLRANPRLRHLPVVVFTAHLSARRDAPEEMRSYEHFIMKPFKPEELVSAIQGALDARPNDESAPA
jgi:CheY-like chemotaxis protein